MAQTLYVNPATGSDSAAGSQSAPFKTLTKVLISAQSDTTIQLAAGNYNAASGEVFPLEVPSGVKIVGNEANKGNGILIEGSGQHLSSFEAAQNVTMLLNNDVELRGVTVTNKATRGTGVWLESTNSTVANCTFTKCNREGIFSTGDANPVILNSMFIENDGNGISIARNTKGEVRGNTCKQAGAGIIIDGTSTPQVISNTFSENRYGVIISQESRPVLRNNIIEKSSEIGLSVTGKALPDLGTSKDPGKNIWSSNTQFDVQNNGSNKLFSYGNQLTASKIKGSVEIDGTKEPDDKEPDDKEPDDKEPDDKEPKTLTDIKGHWAETFIRALFDKGLISGFKDGTFKPDAKMTRAEYAALLVKAFNPTPKREAAKFSDVAADFWAKDVIQQAYRSQFLSGFPNGTFRPKDNVQRVQVIVSLVSGLGLGSSDTAVLSFYDDRAAIPDYAKDEVATATKKKMVVNYPQIKQFKPTQDATRAEVATLVYQSLVDAKQMTAINSPYIVSVADGDTPTVVYKDIQGHWAANFITALAKANLISGYADGTFKPDAKITRAQYAALLVKALNPTTKRDALKFSDVPADFWAKDAIQQAYRSKFISGFPNGTFKPNENVQRVQVLVSLVSGLGLGSSDTGILTVYDDRATIPDYAKPAVATATNKQIVVNYPQIKQLKPNQDATRAEVAVMVYQSLVDANKMSAIDSPYIVSA